MTSYQKRKAAVEHCIEHGKDYKATAANFGCTYQQVYGWVRLYHAGGLERLSGRRGKALKKIPEIIEENKRLKKKESALELEIAVHRELQQYLLQQLHEEQSWSVCELCKAVGVSRAAYYKWKNRIASQKQSDDEKLANLIFEIYQGQHGIFGYRQMKLILERRYGVKCNLKHIYRLMRILGLCSVCRRKKRRSKKKRPAEYIAENVLNREFTAYETNEKWLTYVMDAKHI